MSKIFAKGFLKRTTQQEVLQLSFFGFSLMKERTQWTSKQLANIHSAIFVSVSNTLYCTLMHCDFETRGRMDIPSSEHIFMKVRSIQLTKFDNLRRNSSQTESVEGLMNVVNFSDVAAH